MEAVLWNPFPGKTSSLILRLNDLGTPSLSSGHMWFGYKAAVGAVMRFHNCGKLQSGRLRLVACLSTKRISMVPFGKPRSVSLLLLRTPTLSRKRMIHEFFGLVIVLKF